MSPWTLCCLCYALLLPSLFARSGVDTCGTYPGNWREALDHHAKVSRRHAADAKSRRASALPRRDADIGNVAVIENDESLFGRRNPFNLDRSRITFTPSGAAYIYATAAGGFNQVAAGSGNVLRLGDDDSRLVSLPFSFPFFGVLYRELWINSDGNVTFGAGDSASSARSLGRMAAGPPRIAPLFTDLDPSLPSGSVRTTSTPDGFTVSWLRVPEFSDFGNGRPQTFQLHLSPDGVIIFAWDGVNIADGVVGISPGDSPARPLLASFLQNPNGSHNAMIAERFGDAQALDLVAAARRFYETHDDAYDYLAFFNTTAVQPGSGVLAFETTVRSARFGIGDTPVDVGRQYGSPYRLQAVLNMGPLTNFLPDPNAPHPRRSSTGDTGLTILAHEIGHLFLAFASVRDPADPGARPMLGRQLFHWNFRFNSEASLLEGNRIRDNGPNATPRFTTTATVEGFAPLDQYLMGLRAPEAVPPTFLVENATTSLTDPRVGVSFNGTRRDVTVEDLIAVEGPRIPDHTVEQRRYRVAMILIVPAGAEASSQDLALLERYREALEAAWPRYSAGRGSVEGTLRRAVRLSIEPATGAILGSPVAVTVSLQQPADAPVTVAIVRANGLIDGPSSITIPAGALSAAVTFSTLRPGVEIIRGEPLGNGVYMTTEARLQIVPSPSALQLRVLAGDRQVATPGQLLPNPIVLKLSDGNDLPYPNVRIVANGAGVTPPAAFTGLDGRVTFLWTPAAGPLNVVTFAVAGSALPVAQVTALGRPAFTASAIVNAASFRAGITPGGIATIFGSNLAQPTVHVGGIPALVFYADDRQINFAVPAAIPIAPAAVVEVQTGIGSASASVPVFPVQPGLFFHPVTGRAAAIDRGGRIFELYGTGFGTAAVISAQVGGRPAAVLFHGPAPGFTGLYQVNIRVDAAVPPGEQPVSLTAAGIASNEVKLTILP